jgi:hypothetical protein
VAWIVWAALGSTAYAGTKVAVVALDGDSSNGQLTGVVVEVAGESATVIDSDLVDKGLHALAIDGPPSTTETKKLRSKLKVDVVLTGKVAKDGDKLKLSLVATGKGGKSESFSLHFTKSSAKSFRTELAAALDKHISSVSGGADSDDEDDDQAKKPPPKKDKDKDKEIDDITKRPSRDDRPSRRVAKRTDDDSDDGDGGSVHKRHHAALADSDHNALTQGAIWLDAGAGGLRRTLTYGAGGNPPPKLGTAGATAALDAAYYSGDGPSGFGAVVSVRQTLGVSIAVPKTAAKCAITEAAYTLGARYRMPLSGTSSIAFGANYWRYRYIADRAPLGDDPTELDMPDVDYSAIAPAGEIHYAVSPTTAVSAALTIPIIFSTGPASTGYGAAGGISLTLDAGLDFKLAEHYGLHIGGVFDQLGIKLEGTKSTVAAMRGLSSMTDRTVGAIVAVALLY